MQSIQSLLEVCNHASKEANESIKDLVGKREAYKSVYMGADGTRTRLIDDRAEKAIFEVLKSYGNCRILSEEYGEYIPDKKPEITFVIDPLDGTYNAAHGIPFYSTSIAVGNADLSSIYFQYLANFEHLNLTTPPDSFICGENAAICHFYHPIQGPVRRSN
ncbi:inositol monophosphatase family protein [Methanohalophilus profundi]|uniref:inositol monophosphatase family protein n=1 Tax=Methanohalophilus profundi TaxID=2138083 RepID=UPI001CDD0917|nr:inositol monophosphatase family protein [Methanohalophilus profundi]